MKLLTTVVVLGLSTAASALAFPSEQADTSIPQAAPGMSARALGDSWLPVSLQCWRGLRPCAAPAASSDGGEAGGWGPASEQLDDACRTTCGHGDDWEYLCSTSGSNKGYCYKKDWKAAHVALPS